MSTGQYTHKTRNAGELVTDELYNGAHQNQRNNDIPTSCGAHSDDLTEFRATTDPAPANVAAPVVSLGEEIEQYRFVIADIKTAIQGGTPPAQWYTPVTVNSSIVVAKGARVFRSSSQAITQNTLTAISFNTVDYDTGVILPTFDPFFSIAQPTRLTARKTGLYQINSFSAFSTGVTSGAQRFGVRVNGTTNIAASAQAADAQGGQRSYEIGTQYVLNENDYVELVAYQNCAASLSVVSSAHLGLELLNLSGAVTPPVLRTLSITEAGDGTGTVVGTSPSTINCPGTCSEQFVDGSTVTITATATTGVFSAWSGDVPGGSETTNPLTLTMSQDRNITATFSVFAALLTVGVNGPLSTIIPTNVNTFFDLDSGSVITSTVGNAQRVMPVTIIADQIRGGISTALTAGQTVRLRLNINGVGNNTLSVVVTAGQTTFTSSIAAVTLAQDDLVCWEATDFVGATTLNISHISMRYSGGNGFLVGRPNYLTVSANTNVPVFSTHIATALANGAHTWLPKTCVINQGTLKADAATGAATATNLQLRTNNGASNVGSLITLADPATTVRTTVNASLPGTTTGANSDNHDALRSSTGAPASTSVRLMFSYNAAAPDAAYTFYNTGRPNFNHAGLGSGCFPCIFGFNTAAGFSTTEANGRIIWPVTGKFKYFGANAGTTVGTTFTVTLRINGANTALVLSYSGATSWQNDYTTEVAVTAGDLVNYQVVRTGGAATVLDLNAVIGFITT